MMAFAEAALGDSRYKRDEPEVCAGTGRVGVDEEDEAASWENAEECMFPYRSTGGAWRDGKESAAVDVVPRVGEDEDVNMNDEEEEGEGT